MHRSKQHSYSITSSARAERVGDRETERLGGRQIDDQFELGRLLDRDFAGFRPAQNLVDHTRRRAGTDPGSLVRRT